MLPLSSNLRRQPRNCPLRRLRDFAPDRVPAVGPGKWLISTAGGDKPRWSPDGKELYYISLENKLMAVPIKTSSTFEPGIPTPLFEVHTAGFSPYVVAPNNRFLINTPIATADDSSTSITVVVH